jgi:predicted negative regulator of RcsB-dependent stress response
VTVSPDWPHLLAEIVGTFICAILACLALFGWQLWKEHRRK